MHEPNNPITYSIGVHVWIKTSATCVPIFLEFTCVVPSYFNSPFHHLMKSKCNQGSADGSDKPNWVLSSVQSILWCRRYN
jgi:hypothetical protein